MSYGDWQFMELLAKEKHAELLREAENERLARRALNYQPREPVWPRLLSWISVHLHPQPVAVITRQSECAPC
jgi:hypothetical protein